jgi:D-alanyl-D-alanine carboxypeptidase
METDMTNWPNQAGMNAFYGNPDVNNDGVADLDWQAVSLTTITPPYPMFYAGKPVKRITCHKRVADSLLRILTEIGRAYGETDRRRLGLDEFGGVYNFRRKRGGKTLSIHSWAAAIDLAPSINAFGRKYNEAAGMMPMKVVRIFEREGWTWGGLWSNHDAMHFQAASVK